MAVLHLMIAAIQTSVAWICRNPVNQVNELCGGGGGSGSVCGGARYMSVTSAMIVIIQKFLIPKLAMLFLLHLLIPSLCWSNFRVSPVFRDFSMLVSFA